MNLSEAARGCWMFKPPSQGKQGGILAALNRLNKTWSKRWVWVTEDALHYASRKPTNGRSEDNSVPLSAVLEARAVDAKFMIKKGADPDAAHLGWILRTEKKDILWAAPDESTRDRFVFFFGKYRAWLRIGQPDDEEDGIAFLRHQLIERDPDNGPSFSDTSSQLGGQSSAAYDYDEGGTHYWDEMMEDEADEGDDLIRPRNATPSTITNGGVNDEEASCTSSRHASTIGGSDSANMRDRRERAWSRNTASTQQRSTTPTAMSRQPTADSLLNSGSTTRRRQAAQTIHFQRRPDHVAQLVTGLQSGGGGNPRSQTPPLMKQPQRSNIARSGDDLADWDDIDGGTVSSSTGHSPQRISGGPKETHATGPTAVAAPAPVVVVVGETQRALQERIRQRKLRAQMEPPKLALGGGAIHLDNELDSASPSPRAFALLCRRRVEEPITTTSCAATSLTPLRLPLEALDEFAALVDHVTFLDRSEHIIGSGVGTTEGLMLRKAGVMDQSRFARCAHILNLCEQLHPRRHEPNQVVVEDMSGCQTTFSVEFGAYVVAQVVQRQKK